MESKFWIEKGWGDSSDNVNYNHVEEAILQISEIDDEHGAFWIGNYENENILEVHKDLKVFYVCEENQNQQKVLQLFNWNEVKNFFSLFLNEDYKQLSDKF